jgi:hypothetical protein
MTHASRGVFFILALLRYPLSMPSLALIPGFATDTHFSGFRGPWGPDGGFRAFRSLVENGDATVFRWGLRKHATFFDSFSPWFAWRLYREERQLTEQAETLRRLSAWLEHEQPHTIVCHSLGCRLFVRALKMHGAPASLRRIVFNQADLSIDELVDATSAAPTLQFVNTYCPWDASLLCSSVLNGGWRVGLRATPIPSIQNRFFPLWRFPNLHMSAIRDEAFKDLSINETP